MDIEDMQAVLAELRHLREENARCLEAGMQDVPKLPFKDAAKAPVAPPVRRDAASPSAAGAKSRSRSNRGTVRGE